MREATARITGGTESVGYPWLGAIWTDKVHCAVGLISDYWVLTAAHCVIGGPDNRKSIMFKFNRVRI